MVAANDLVYRINGNTISQFQETPVYAASAAAFLEELKNALLANAHPSALLPRGCRFFVDLGNVRRFVMEVPPSTVKFKWTTFYSEQDDIDVDGDSVDVAVPWQYFVFDVSTPAENPYGVEGIFTETKLFWGIERVTHLNSRIHPAWLPNINLGTGLICLGEATPSSEGPVSERMESIVGDFFESEFNGDLGWRSNIPYGDPYLWRDETKLDPACWAKWSIPTTRAEFSAWMGVYDQQHILDFRRQAPRLINEALYRAASRG